MGHFCPPGSRIRIPIPDPDTDPLTGLNPNPDPVHSLIFQDFIVFQVYTDVREGPDGNPDDPALPLLLSPVLVSSQALQKHPRLAGDWHTVLQPVEELVVFGRAALTLLFKLINMQNSRSFAAPLLSLAVYCTMKRLPNFPTSGRKVCCPWVLRFSEIYIGSLLADFVSCLSLTFAAI